MAILESPGVQVTVIDESFYTPAAPGTVPMIFVATAQDKTNPSGSIAQGTTAANAGKVWVITSQRDLTDTFGSPVFYTDINKNPRHGDEMNEYGLQAAYSVLGVSSRAYVVRADLDLKQLSPSSSIPQGDPLNGTYWLDSDSSKYGLKEWNNTTKKFTVKTPLVLDDTSTDDKFDGVGPASSVGQVGDYCFIINQNSQPITLWYKKSYTQWLKVEQGFDDGKVIQISSHIQYPFSFAEQGAPTGSLWITTTIPTNGANWNMKLYNGQTKSWIQVPTPIYGSAAQANKELDPSNGGKSIPVGSLYVEYSKTEPEFTPMVEGGSENETVNPEFIVYRRNSTGVVSASVTSSELVDPSLYYVFEVKETRTNNVNWNKEIFYYTHPGESFNTSTIMLTQTLGTIGGNAVVEIIPDPAFADIASVSTATPIFSSNPSDPYRVIGINLDDLGSGYKGTVTIRVTDLDNDNIITQDINVDSSYFTKTDVKLGKMVADMITDSQDLTQIVAVWNDVTDTLTITHTGGGDIQLKDIDGAALESLGFYGNEVYYDVFDQDAIRISNWRPLSYVARPDAPSTDAADGRVWYDSNLGEVDIMVHDGDTWVGYRTMYPDTDPEGPMVSATEPLAQSDGTDLETNDIWVDTSKPDQVGRNIYVYDASISVGSKWVKQNVTDQSTPDGWLFADARWGDTGEVSPSDKVDIKDLLISDYLDPDAPDPALYPRGMKLWNTRRSGWNVKKFVSGHINIYANEGLNIRYNEEDMSSYNTGRWVAQYPRAEDGGPQFGRLSQRAQVVNAFKKLIDTNQSIRDRDTLNFNLIATPGYPEAIQNMIAFNNDRGITAFVVGDTPFRLVPNGTTLTEWGLNSKVALDNGDLGATSYDEYMAMWYPSGYTNDNVGNKIVVPPSHMMLRTIINSDAKSYPWFAPAGTRRGGIDNATSVGYIDGEGEFRTVALNNSLRDVLDDVKINPIATLTGVGLLAYGQRTRARNASALDRINVARLVCYLRRQLDIMARPFLFEPNDAQTRREIKAAAESLLLELVGQRALYDFIVVCDESNNTPARIDRNELYLDIAIEPVKAVEFIYIPLRLKNTGDIAAGL